MNEKALELFLAETHIGREVFEYWIERRWIIPASDDRRVVSEVDASRALFIRELRDDLGVNDEGIGLVLHLLDQVHGLRHALLSVRTELATTGHGPPAADD